ncbi:MAG TPA: hypothetical protein EYP79_02125 [Campylobacterales bacterium]|nr:hypothetical protein [Campylobacterales bacterium]
MKELNFLIESASTRAENILIASVNGLKGFLETINYFLEVLFSDVLFIKQDTQKYVSHKHKKEFMPDLKNATKQAQKKHY